jgi:hypothetical protein
MNPTSIKIGKSAEKLSSDVELPLRTMTLHGMIGGSTGTGKSRAIQVLAEQLIEAGVPVLLADLKGDMGGFVIKNSSKKVAARAKKFNMEYSPKSFPTNFFSVSGSFIPLRLRLDEIDPTLVARVLKYNSIQESNLKLAFLHAKKKQLPIRDLVDLKKVIKHLSKNSNSVSKSSAVVMQRQLDIAIGDGINELFSLPDLEISDLLEPRITVLNLGNWRRKTELPSILMAFILYRLFNELEDVGQLEKPRIVLFIDEAHYIFHKANPELTDLFITILKQIRSKGVGVFLSSQNPEDIPEKVLEQLGCKIQFALRAFTQDELQDIKGIAKSFPPTNMDLAKEIMSLNIAEAIVSPLSESGKPLPPKKTIVLCPRSSMKILSKKELSATINPTLIQKYGKKQSMERYGLSDSMETIRIERRSEWAKTRAEAAKFEKKQARMQRKHWKKMKSIGIFLLAFLILLIILILLLLVLLK